MITRYVNTESTAGGDGTTNESFGSTRAFASLLGACQSLAASNFNDDLQILCCGSTADTGTDIEISLDSIVTAGYSVTIGANRSASTGFHGGVWNPATYRLEATSGANLLSVFCTRILILDGIQFHSSGTITGDLLNCGTFTAFGSTVKNCIFVADGTFTGDGISWEGYCKVENCVFVNKSSGNIGVNLDLSDPYTGTVYNTVVAGWTTGIFSTRTNAKNCAVWNNSNVDFWALSAIDHCASDDGDGTNPITIMNWANQFVKATYFEDADFRIDSSSGLLGSGEGPNYDPVIPTTDIIGTTRSGKSASVGPYETSYQQRPTRVTVAIIG